MQWFRRVAFHGGGSDEVHCWQYFDRHGELKMQITQNRVFAFVFVVALLKVGGGAGGGHVKTLFNVKRI
jgi:hypothetical protein